MQNALTFIFKTILDLYIITFVLRLILQWVRADFRNPMTQFIVRITNPLVIPLRRIMPSVGGLDTATLVVILILELLATIVLINLSCSGTPDFLQVASLTLLRFIYLVLRVYLFMILIYVIMSWVNPGTYNPAVNLLASVVEPALRPLRRVIPPIAGFDLSALFALIGIQALTMVLPIGRVVGGMGCFAPGQLL